MCVKTSFDATNARKFREGKDYSFNGNVDPRIGVYQHVYPEIPQSAYNMLQIHHSDAESLSGVKAYSSGINSSSLGEVAAGMKPALDAASRRETSILRRLAYGVVLIGRKIVSLNAELLSDEEVIRITDEEFVTVRRDDLPGNYDIRPDHQHSRRRSQGPGAGLHASRPPAPMAIPAKCV